MADQKISELGAATSAASADLLHVVQGGTNKKLTVANLFGDIDTNVKLDGYIALKGTPQAVTAAGSTVAINVTSAISQITSTSATTGGNALTLADGVQGQIKVITMIVDGGDVEVTPDNLAGGTTITFNNVGDVVTLLFTNSNWVIISNVGCFVA